MKRFIGFLSTLLLIFAISQNVTALVLDDVTIDENITFSKNKNEKTDRVTIRFHNYPDDITDNLRLTLNEEEIFKPDYTLTSDRITRYYYILIDNSGSIKEQDLSAIRKNVSYLISHINPQDYVEVITVSDYSSAIYKLSHYNPNVMTRIDGIIREGTYSRLYDAVSELNTKVIKKKQNEKASENEVLYYILFFSDGEDIASTTTGRQMRDGYRDIPFYYFCYASDFKPEKNKPFQDIADKHGKFFNYLDTDKIDSLFFSNENRYTLVFFINKKEILKTKSYYIELSKRTTEEGKIIIDLRKYFDGSNLNDMIVDAPKDNTLYNNMRNNLAHDTQYAYKKPSGDENNTVVLTDTKKSNDNEMLNQVQQDSDNKTNDDKNSAAKAATSTETTAGERSRTTVTENNQNNNVTSTETERSADNNELNQVQHDNDSQKTSDNKTGIAVAAAAGTATAAALNNKSDKQKSSTPTETTADKRSQTTVAENNQNNNVTSTETERSADNNELNQVQHDNDSQKSLGDENNTDTAKSDTSDNLAAVSDGDDTYNDNAATAVIIPAKAEKQQKQPKQTKTVKEKTKTTKETKEKSDKDNKWWLWLLLILLLLLLLLLLLWLIWWLIRKISDNSRAKSNGGGGRSSGGIDRTPVETYSPPPTPIASSSSSAAKKPAPKPAAPSNKIKLRIAKDSYRKAKNRIDTNEKGIPTFIDGIDKDEGKLKVGSAITIVDICEDHVTAQSMTSLQPDDIVTINKADFLVIYVRYRSKVYTFDIIPLDPNYDIMKNVKKTDSVTTAEKTVAVYGTKQAVINKMLAPAKVDIITNKWSDGTIDNVTGQTDKVIHSDSPLYLDYVVEIQHGAKAGLYLITDVQYENRKYTGKIKPL